MKKVFRSFAACMLLAAAVTSCKKSGEVMTDPNALTDTERALVKAAGFNSAWADKNADGTFLVENDMLFSKAELQELANGSYTNNIIVGNEEHYRTNNVVSLPATGQRTITVRLGSGFPTYYSTALDNALARYNNLNLRIRFTRVTSGGNIVVSAANLGTSGGGCILGQASGFPSGGNPSSGFTLSNSSCATSYLNTTDKADEVIAHEIGHCIGFRHTDYRNRASCGPGGGESAGSIGAVHIPGTPTNVSGSYNSWMMACTNGSPVITSADGVALNYVY